MSGGAAFGISGHSGHPRATRSFQPAWGDECGWLLTKAGASGTNAHPARPGSPRMARRSCRLFHVDAFTRIRFAGNPAVVVLDADELTDEDMHRIAREINGTAAALGLPSA